MKATRCDILSFITLYFILLHSAVNRAILAVPRPWAQKLERRRNDQIPQFYYKSQILEWAKCGDDYLSAVPTLLWTLGAVAFARRLLNAMFRRFLFRRVPVWEQILQHLLFIWMVLYSLHFWHALVRILKALVEYYDEDDEVLLDKELTGLHFMQQSVIWLCGATPLAIYMCTRQRSSEPPLMIWITTNPWQRREMGPYGYYLNRPFSTMESFNDLSIQERTLMLRRAHSDTKITTKEPPRKRRSSKSV